jgi:two-component system chemotaxis sensor kinase CheA
MNVKTIGGSARVVQVREDGMPVIGLDDVFQVPRFDFEHVVGITVEAEGGRVALIRDVGALVRRPRH